MHPDLLWLGEPGCDETALTGGKAANLSRLAAVHPVPPGFCLTTAAFTRGAGAFAREGVLPLDLRHRLVAAYGELAQRCGASEPSVAVRSSAADEDGAAASFAGQHDTYLNVAGAEAVVAAVGRCWASAFTERALEYRRRQGLSAGGVSLAVLVQQLVQADVAAVVFSANPVTGSRDEVVIDASWGLGESVVGGSVTPDTYVVAKATGEVLSRRIAEKTRMTVTVAGGTEEVDVPRFLRTRPALADAQAQEMARLALELEQATGWPVDVECALAGGQLYLLQCRPITTLAREGAP